MTALLTPAPVRRRPRWVRILAWGSVAVVVGFLVFATVWRVTGGRWERVETPSMGPVAPVGTLLWITPVPFDQLKVGDFITFHPPGDSATTYSHRVYSINADHTISTKGVIPAPDPWKLTAHDIVGKVSMRWWGIGWVVQALPILLIGALFAVAVLHFLRSHWRLPAGLVLGALVVTIAITVYRPFINAQQIAFAPQESGGASASYVGTGLLPIRLQAHDGARVDLQDGHVGTVHVREADATKHFRVSLKPAVPFWFWVALVLACFLPAIVSLLAWLRALSR